MKITSQEEYGLRCLVQLALQTKTEPLASLESIAKAENITTDYAAKLLMVLRKGMLVESVRGKSGGYKLAKPPEMIHLDEVIRVLSGELFDDLACSQLDLDAPEAFSAGSVRSFWLSASHILFNIFRQITLKNLMDNEDILMKYIKKELVTSI